VGSRQKAESKKAKSDVPLVGKLSSFKELKQNPIDPANPVKRELYSVKNQNRKLARKTGSGGSEIVNLPERQGQAGPKCKGLDPQYTYDLNGNRTSMIGPGGMTWTYEYDSASRLTKITNPDSDETTFTYDANSRRTSMTYANGVITTYSYDDAGRLTNLITQNSELITLNSFTYTHDNVGNRITMTDNYGIHTYQYDDVYQLTKAIHPQAYNPEETFNFDAVGNRLSSYLSTDYGYDNLNRLLEDDDYAYTYDDNGNLTSKMNKITSATTAYQYNSVNMLIQVDTPTDVVKYQYDGFGRRIVRTVNNVVTKYIYDNEDILFELDEDENITARYTHGPGIDAPISIKRDTDIDGVLDTTFYYHQNEIGSVIAMTDSSGNVVQSYVYDAYGRIVQKTGSVGNSYTYTGREWDAAAELYYFRARYYNPGVGRFINADPIGFAGGDVNLYDYVQNDPINTMDPSGLRPWYILDCKITQAQHNRRNIFNKCPRSEPTIDPRIKYNPKNKNAFPHKDCAGKYWNLRSENASQEHTGAVYNRKDPEHSGGEFECVYVEGILDVDDGTYNYFRTISLGHVRCDYGPHIDTNYNNDYVPTTFVYHGDADVNILNSN
jgi:RHS repeat-associated protein